MSGKMLGKSGSLVSPVSSQSFQERSHDSFAHPLDGAVRRSSALNSQPSLDALPLHPPPSPNDQPQYVGHPDHRTHSKNQQRQQHGGRHGSNSFTNMNAVSRSVSSPLNLSDSSYDSEDRVDGATINSEQESEEDETVSWVQWFCSLEGHEFFCQVADDFIEDGFNLTGLQLQVPLFNDALDRILDIDPEASFSEDQMRRIDSAAEMLYSLIHQRFLITRPGLAMMREKFLNGVYGTCPRIFCRQQKVLPIGLSDQIREGRVQIFCPRCSDVYDPPSKVHQTIDGAAFGASAAHILIQYHPDILDGLKPVWESMSAPLTDRTAQAEYYIPKIYGFRIHSQSAHGPRMQWLRLRQNIGLLSGTVSKEPEEVPGARDEVMQLTGVGQDDQSGRERDQQAMDHGEDPV